VPALAGQPQPKRPPGPEKEADMTDMDDFNRAIIDVIALSRRG
jgi:hypothetical protein